EPNRGVAFVRTPCPHTDLKAARCDPRQGMCKDAIRYVPVELLDVAGLVPKAHEGRGLGNKFLDDLRVASGLIHVVDASGATNEEGVPVARGTHDPLKDVAFLEDELAHWIAGIATRGLDKDSRSAEMSGQRLDPFLTKRLTGLGVDEHQVKHAFDKSPLDPIHFTRWTPEATLAFGQEIRRLSKPVLIAANKVDAAPPELIERLRGVADTPVVPTSAESELALRKAADAGVVEYLPGAKSFKVPDPAKLTAAQTKALDFIRTHVLEPFGSTGVQEAVERGVYGLLKLVPVFPVEDETHYTDGEGRILPDCKLVPQGTTARQLAYKVHTDLGEHFVRAVDARTKRTIGADHVLKAGDVVKIAASK
ncbi:MAG TPA: YchF-related putative GTPase, partial [Candidatus Thermoplasmatota archaeon]|nr:YchF-related putative GTPase [Candidatus Thermoplasmatota archaeon]